MSWSELFGGKSSIYALDENSKEWVDRGISGHLVMVQNNQYRQDVRIKWSKNSKEVWWRLMNGKLKPKGERAWVLKAWDIASNKQEILAIRFSDVALSQQFMHKFHYIFPPPQPQASSPSNNPAQQHPAYAQHQFMGQQHPNYQGQFGGNMMGMPGMNMHFGNLMMNSQPHLNAMGGLQRSKTSPNAKWECAVCTYSNDATKSSCIMCGLSRDNTAAKQAGAGGGRPHSASMPSQYHQAQSQHFNFAQKGLEHLHGSQSQQNMIRQFEAHRKDASAVTSPHSKQRRTSWICPMCTLHNSIAVTRCDACGASRNNKGSPAAEGVGGGGAVGMGMPMGGGGGGGSGSGYNQFGANGHGQGPGMAAVNAFGAQPNAMGNQWGAANQGHYAAGPLGMGYAAQPYQAPQGQFGGVMGGFGGMQQGGMNRKVATVNQFQQSASDIACYNDNPSQVFSTLRSVAKKLLKDDVRYRTLDTTNPKVMERLIGFEGVLDFLMLLGFSSDAMGMKLVCQQKPSQQVVRNAIDVLNTYESRLGLGRQKKPKQGQPHGMGSGGGGYGGSKKEDDVESRQTLGGPDDFGDGAGGGSKDEDGSDSLTLEQIIIWSTHENMRDSDTMETLILTHKQFTTSVTLLKSLRRRFFVPIPVDIVDDAKKVEEFRKSVEKRIQLKVIKSLRDWMKQYWDEDMLHDFELQKELCDWLAELKRVGDDKYAECPWIRSLCATTQKEYDRFKQHSPGQDKRMELAQWAQDPETGVPLALKEIPIKKSFKLSNITAEELAEQITLMDFATFSRIRARECIGQCWKKKKEESPNILAMIKQFNQLTVLVQLQILKEKSLRDRGKAIKRVIKMGDRFRTLKNYNSLCAVLGALNSSPIHRLKCAWARVPEKQLTIFENFKNIFANTRNFRNFRMEFRNALPPAIPYFGLFLQDLVFIDDGNASSIQHDNLKQHGFMVNFSKCVRTMDRIKHGLAEYQKEGYVDLKPQKTLQKILYQELHTMAQYKEDQIWNMSTKVRNADQKAAGVKQKK